MSVADDVNKFINNNSGPLKVSKIVKNTVGDVADVGVQISDLQTDLFLNGKRVGLTGDYKTLNNIQSFLRDQTGKDIDIERIDDAFRKLGPSNFSIRGPLNGSRPPVETKPVDSMPDMPENQNNSMIPDLDLKTGGLVLAAGVLGLALLRGDS